MDSSLCTVSLERNTEKLNLLNLARIDLKRVPPNAMETEVIHTTRKGKSILLLFFSFILNYSVGSIVIDVFPIQTLIITP